MTDETSPNEGRDRKRYVVLVAGRRREIPAASLRPWLEGYVARMATEDGTTGVGAIEAVMERTPAYPRDQWCYLCLRAAHLDDALVYLGIVTDGRERTLPTPLTA